VSATVGAPRRTPPGALHALDVAERWFLVVAAAALAVFAVAVVVTPSTFGLPSLFDLDGDELLRFTGAVVVYALSHFLRFVRLALLIHTPALRVRRVLQVHLYTAGLSVLLPFKLGEIIRIREVGVVARSWQKGILAVWLERAFDAAVLIVLVLVTIIAVDDSLSLVTPILVVVSVFVALTVILMTVAPENIRELMLHLVRRPYGERTVPVLRVLRGVLAALEEAPRMVRGRFGTLLVLSAAIWLAEVVAVAIALPGLGTEVSRISSAMLSLLASLSSGATPIMSASGDRMSDALADAGLSPDVDLYRLVLVLPVLIAATAAAAAYLPWRLRRA
jgi:hypothetical protein